MEAMKAIRLLAFDVDGTLTTGTICMGPEGEISKTFHARDGMGMVLARKAGLVVGIITGRAGAITERRANELGLDFCCTGVRDKVAVMEELLQTHGLTWEEAGFMGDDWNDLGVLVRVGVSAAPADATKEVLDTVHLRMQSSGGQGAAREWIEMILQAQGKWKQMLSQFSE